MSAFRQAIVLIACLLVLLIIGAVLAESIVRRQFDARIENELRARFDGIARDIEANGFSRDAYPNTTDEIIFFQAEQSDAYPEPEGLFELRGAFDDDRWDWQAGDPSGLAQDPWYFYVGETAGSVLAVGRNLGQGALILAVVPLIFFGIGLVISVITLSVGVAFSLRTQRRLNRISRALHRAKQGHFESRVAPPDARDDLDDLALNIDRTLIRLETLFNQSRNIAANIAHDLKTPITRLRLRLETALHSDDIEQVKDNVEESLTQADHIIGVFEAFLGIAQLETGHARKRFAPVRLAELVEEVAQTFGPVVEDAGLGFATEISGDALVQGDEVLLTQMLTNLIENAMSHTPPGTCITLVANTNEIGVADNGPGIPQDAISEVTKPSVRLDTSRTSHGAGLGLALVKAIAEVHDAELVLSESPYSVQRGLFVRARFV